MPNRRHETIETEVICCHCHNSHIVRIEVTHSYTVQSEAKGKSLPVFGKDYNFEKLVVQEIAEALGVKPMLIYEKGYRRSDTVRARWIIAYAFYSIRHPYSYKRIADFFNHSDHTAVIHGRNRLNKLLVDGNHRKLEIAVTEITQYLESRLVGEPCELKQYNLEELFPKTNGR